MLQTKVKAGSVTNLTDARYFAAWEVEWLGFTLDPTAQPHLSPRDMMAIREWIEGVRFVGEFNLQTAAELETSIRLLRLDDLLVGPLTEASTLAELQADIPVIKELLFDREEPVGRVRRQLESFAPHAALFQLSLDKQGYSWEGLKEDRPVSVECLRDWAADYPLLLGIRIDPEDIPELLGEIPLTGLSVQGGAEEQVGYKSFEELDAFFEAIVEEEA